MKKLGIAVAAVVLALGACVSAAELPTAEQLLEKVTAAYASMKSFEADMRIEYSTGEQVFAAHLAMQKSEKDGQIVEKSSMIGKTTLKDATGKHTNYDARTVNDGTFSWTESHDAREISVTKVDAGPGAFRMTAYLGGMTRAFQDFGFKIVGEEMIGEKKTYVMEGGVKKLDEAVRHLTMRVLIGPEDFIVRRMYMAAQRTDQEQPTWSTVDWQNVKVNQPVDPALFVYTPPEGAKIVDRTKPKPAA